MKSNKDLKWKVLSCILLVSVISFLTLSMFDYYKVQRTLDLPYSVKTTSLPQQKIIGIFPTREESESTGQDYPNFHNG